MQILRPACVFALFSVFFLPVFLARAEEPIHVAELREVLEATRAEAFPELRDTRLEIAVQDLAEDSFLQIQPTKASLFGARKNRIYELQASPRLLENPPSRAALRAILTHELEHVLEYSGLSIFGVIRLGIRYSTDESFVTEFERATDLRALERGAGPGLIEYRQWLYPFLNEEQLQKKRRDYLTPEEIEAWLRVDHGRN